MVSVGDKVKVRYKDEFTYTLDAQVCAVGQDEFTARVERVLSERSEVTGGHVLAVVGQEMVFKNEDIVAKKPLSHLDEVERKSLQDNVAGWHNRLCVMERAQMAKPSNKDIEIVRRELERAEQYLQRFNREHDL